MSDSLLHPLVATALRQLHINHKTLACDPALADTTAFCKHYGFTLEQSANTIIVASRTDPAAFVACLVLASTKLDVNKQVRALMGTRKVSFASVEQTVAQTGMIIGGVTIVGLPANMPVYVDSAVMQQPEVILGGGNRDSKLVIDPKELLKIPRLEVIENLALPRL